MVKEKENPNLERFNNLFNPIKNKFFIGHENAEKEFLKNFQKGEIPHSWIITGDKGIGKATFAYRIAKFLLYKDSVEQSNSLLDDENDNVDSLDIPTDNSFFERVANGGHSDLKMIEKTFDLTKNKMKTQILVDDIKNINQFFSLTSSESKYRIVVIDSVDDMNKNAANALLKILEEPPKNSFLILIVHNLQSVLPTIKSRCRIVRFNKLSDENLAILIKKYLPNIKDDEIKALVNISKGSIGRAIDLYNNGGITLFNSLVSQLNKFLSSDKTGMFDLVNDINSDDDLLDLSIVFLKDFLLKSLKLKDKMEVSFYNDFEKSIIEKIANEKTTEGILNIFNDMERLFIKAKKLNMDMASVLISIFTKIGG